MAVKMEVFSGNPPCPGCVAILELADKVRERYTEDELEIIKYIGEEGMAKFEEYKMLCVPAIVVNGTVKIEGTCPDWKTTEDALREGGLCIK